MIPLARRSDLHYLVDDVEVERATLGSPGLLHLLGGADIIVKDQATDPDGNDFHVARPSPAR